MVHRGPFRKYRGRWISMDGLDATVEMCYKTHLIFLKKDEQCLVKRQIEGLNKLGIQ